MSVNFNKVKRVLELDDSMPIGIYQGSSLAEVITDNAGYLQWMLLNCENIQVSDMVKSTLQYQIDNPPTKRRIKIPGYWSMVPSIAWEDDIPF